MHNSRCIKMRFLCKEKSVNVKHFLTLFADIPSNRLSDFIEVRVNNFLARKKIDSGEVTIRVVASSKEITTVKPRYLVILIILNHGVQFYLN